MNYAGEPSQADPHGPEGQDAPTPDTPEEVGTQRVSLADLMGDDATDTDRHTTDAHTTDAGTAGSKNPA